MPDVRILSQQKLVRYINNTPVIVQSVTYLFADRPPRTVDIPENEYSETKRADAIRADIQNAAQSGPNVIQV